MNLTSKSIVSSLVYKFIERVGVKITALVISIVLARLLAPEVFGIVAIVTVLVEVFRVFVQGGLNTALIQRQEIDDADYSTVFWLGLAIATICYAGLFWGAPFIASYYANVELILIVRVLSIELFFGAYNSVQTASLSRKMMFRPQMICNLIVTILAGAVGIGMSVHGFGVWALVSYHLLSQILICIAFMFVIEWRPRFIFSFSKAKILVGYGWKILISNLMYSVYVNVRSLIIGKRFSTGDLAFYDKGNQFPATISFNLDTAIQSVMLPSLSRKQNEKSEIERILRRMVKTGTYILFPIMIGLACISKSMVYVLLTEKWSSSVPYVFIFSLGYLFITISSSCNVAVKALGRSDIYAKNQLLRLSCMFTILLISVLAFKSAIAIAVGYAVSLLIEMLLAILPVRSLIGYTYHKLFCDTIGNLVISCVMGVTVYLFYFLKLGYIETLLLQICVGAGEYLSLSFLTKNETFFYCIKILKGFISDRKGMDVKIDS